MSPGMSSKSEQGKEGVGSVIYSAGAVIARRNFARSKRGFSPASASITFEQSRACCTIRPVCRSLAGSVRGYDCRRACANMM